MAGRFLHGDVVDQVESQTVDEAAPASGVARCTLAPAIEASFPDRFPRPLARTSDPCAGNFTLPQHVTFITFGDSDWSRAYRPALAAIRSDRYREGRWAASEVLVSPGSQDQPEDAPPVARL